MIYIYIHIHTHIIYSHYFYLIATEKSILRTPTVQLLQLELQSLELTYLLELSFFIIIIIK